MGDSDVSFCHANQRSLPFRYVGTLGSKLRASVSTIWHSISSLLWRGASLLASTSSPATESTMAALPKWQEQSTKEATPSVSMKSTSTPTVSQMSQALQQSTLAAPPSERTVGSGRPTNELEKILRLARFNGSFGHSSQLNALTSIEEKAT